MKVDAEQPERSVPQSTSGEPTDPGPVDAEYAFDAFVSYRRRDAAPLALWLRRRLKRYELPAEVTALIRQRARPSTRRHLEVFVDSVFARANKDFWEQNIVPNLAASRYLVVISTPQAFLVRSDGQPNWLTREIDTFLSGSGPERVIVVLGPRGPEDRFPGRLSEFGNRWDWADCRDFTWRRFLSPRRWEALDGAFTKIVASLYDVPATVLPLLRQEEERRRGRILLSILGGALAAIAITVSLAIWAITERNTARQNFLEMLRRDSQRLAAAAEGQLEAGRPDLAVLIAREAFGSLPARLGAGPRPPVPEAAIALTRALGERPISTWVVRVETGIQSAALDPNAQRVALITEDGWLSILERSSGRVIRRWRAHQETPRSTVFSPDGATLLTASHDRTARHWEVETGKLLREFRHEGIVRSATFAPGGDRIVTASLDGTARIWGTRSGEVLLGVGCRGGRTGEPPPEIYDASLALDGTKLVLACANRAAQIVNARTGAELLRLTGHAGALSSARFSRDGRQIVTSSKDTVRIWDALKGVVLHVLRGHSADVRSAVFSPDGRSILTASDDGTARLWETSTGTALHVLRGHSFYVMSASFSPDGAQVLTASWDRSLRLWDLRNDRISLTVRAHTEGIAAVAFAPTGALLVDGSWDGTAIVWDAETGRKLHTVRGQGQSIVSVAFSRDGGRFATASVSDTLDRGVVQIWDARTGQALLTLSEQPEGIASVTFSPDGSRVLSACNDGTARIWDSITGEHLVDLAGEGDAIASAAFSPDGARVVTGAFDGSAVIWNARTGARVRSLTAADHTIQSVAFTGDGARIMTATGNGVVSTWDAQSGRRLLQFAVPGRDLESAALSSDGRLIVTSAKDGTARIWDATSGDALAAYFNFDYLGERSDERREISAVSFSPDGSRVALGLQDGRLLFWKRTGMDSIANILAEASRVVRFGFTDVELQQFGIMGH